jgi:hypothetical protein
VGCRLIACSALLMRSKRIPGFARGSFYLGEEIRRFPTATQPREFPGEKGDVAFVG